MFVTLKYNEYGIAHITGEFQTKGEINLVRGETVSQTSNFEAFRIGIEKRNKDRKAFLMSLGKNKIVSQSTGIVETPLITKENISESGKELIKLFLEDPSDYNLGKVMEAHNDESWSTHVFCCSNQKQQMINLFKTILSSKYINGA